MYGNSLPGEGPAAAGDRRMAGVPGVISISIVSHGQGELVGQALADLARFPAPLDAEILITVNIPEPLPFVAVDFPWPVRIVENASPKGFGGTSQSA